MRSANGPRQRRGFFLGECGYANGCRYIINHFECALFNQAFSFKIHTDKKWRLFNVWCR